MLTIPYLQAVEQSLKSVRLSDGGVGDKRVAEYSGGMKRRLSVAISLIGDPKVIIFTHLTIIHKNRVHLLHSSICPCKRFSIRSIL